MRAALCIHMVIKRGAKQMTINPAAPAANQARQTPHSVVIEDRKRLTATGILSIVSYDSFTATLETPGGTGEVKINGSIEYVQYTAKREKQESLFKRLVR